jgi:hypothetical protein
MARTVLSLSTMPGIGPFLLLASLACFLFPRSGDAEVTVWQKSLVRADKIVSKGTGTTDLFFFDRKGGEFSLTVDDATQRIVSFSGKFRGLKRRVFEALQGRVDAWKAIPGIRQVHLTETTYSRNGRSDLVFNLDLRGMDLWLPDGSYQALFDASKVGFRLGLTRVGQDPLSLSVAMEFPSGGDARELKLLDSGVL